MAAVRPLKSLATLRILAWVMSSWPFSTPPSRRPMMTSTTAISTRVKPICLRMVVVLREGVFVTSNRQASSLNSFQENWRDFCHGSVDGSTEVCRNFDMMSKAGHAREPAPFMDGAPESRRMPSPRGGSVGYTLRFARTNPYAIAILLGPVRLSPPFAAGGLPVRPASWAGAEARQSGGAHAPAGPSRPFPDLAAAGSSRLPLRGPWVAGAPGLGARGGPRSFLGHADRVAHGARLHGRGGGFSGKPRRGEVDLSLGGGLPHPRPGLGGVARSPAGCGIGGGRSVAPAGLRPTWPAPDPGGPPRARRAFPHGGGLRPALGPAGVPGAGGPPPGNRRVHGPGGAGLSCRHGADGLFPGGRAPAIDLGMESPCRGRGPGSQAFPAPAGGRSVLRRLVA